MNNNKKNGAIMYLKTQSGFTLIELSIVIIIIGIFVAGATQTYSIFAEKRQLERMKSRISNAQTSIKEFVAINGRLPCAAPRGIPRTSPKFGREVNCNDFTDSHTKSVPGKEGTHVRIGMLPTRTLGLPDHYILDAYQNTFTYAVTESLTRKPSFPINNFSLLKHRNRYKENTNGGIDVLDITNTSLLSATSYAQYIIISHGKNRKGAYSYNGILIEPCGTEGADTENCNDDSIFRSSDRVSKVGLEYYDDYIIYETYAVTVF